MNKLISTWNPLREMEEAQNRFNRFFSGGFPNRIGSGEIHSLAVADWSPEVDISEDDHGYLLKADLPEMKKDDVKVTVETRYSWRFWRTQSREGRSQEEIPSHRTMLWHFPAHLHAA